MKLGFIGCGNMGSALMRSMHEGSSYEFLAADKNANNLRAVSDIAQLLYSNVQLSQRADIVFLCIKPQDVGGVLSEVKNNVQKKLVISIAAGISLKFLETKLPNAKCVRVMPNLPCVVGEMAAGYSLGKNCAQKDKKAVNNLLNKAGIALEMEESLLDAVTGLSGSGPAFVAYLIEAFIIAGMNQGLKKQEASKLAIQTFLGTALLLKERNIGPQKLIEMVSSPNGTTVAGRSVLEHSDIKEVIRKTVQKATLRSKELGKHG